MRVLKSISCFQTHLHLLSPLRPLCWLVGKSYESTTPYVPPPTVLPGKKSVYEPDYLDQLQPKIPPLSQLDIQMKGYDYVIVERFQQLMHHYCHALDIEVSDGWAVRAESWRIQRFVPQSSKTEAEFNLKEYQRVLQVDQIPSTKVSTLIELLQALVPPGVTCSIVHHTEEMDRARYIPDLEIKTLQKQLDELGGPSKLAMLREKESQFKK